MEFGQGESEMQDPHQNPEGWRRLARAVITQALRDLGDVKISGLPEGPQRESVISFIKSKNFDGMCSLAGWEPDWLLDVFSSVDHLGANVKAKVTRQTIDLIEGLP